MQPRTSECTGCISTHTSITSQPNIPENIQHCVRVPHEHTPQPAEKSVRTSHPNNITIDATVIDLCDPVTRYPGCGFHYTTRSPALSVTYSLARISRTGFVIIVLYRKLRGAHDVLRMGRNGCFRCFELHTRKHTHIHTHTADGLNIIANVHAWGPMRAHSDANVCSVCICMCVCVRFHLLLYC